jgi:hypothetical protein
LDHSPPTYASYVAWVKAHTTVPNLIVEMGSHAPSCPASTSETAFFLECLHVLALHSVPSVPVLGVLGGYDCTISKSVTCIKMRVSDSLSPQYGLPEQTQTRVLNHSSLSTSLSL